MILLSNVLLIMQNKGSKMKDKITLNEGSEEFKAIKEEWKKRSHEITLETLPEFLKELSENYAHDYGTICHAIATASIATASAINNSEQGGITGFQSGAIMWQFIREWNYSNNKTGLKLVDYDNFLYPKYADKFEKTLSSDIFNNIKKEAQSKIEKADNEYKQYLIDIEQYKKDIADYILKYPDYYDNKEYYDPLVMGTGEQWEQEKNKKESGFDFAPQEPYCPVNKESNVYKHWQSIINGIVPFGYVIVNNQLMSRTTRTKRPKMRIGTLSYMQYKNG